MLKVDRLCLFYHHIGGRKRCTRADCGFIHNIQDRVNLLLDKTAGEASAEKIKTLLSMADSASQPAQEISAHDWSNKKDADAGDAALGMARDAGLGNETACGSEVDLYIAAEITAQAAVVDAVATTEDRMSPTIIHSIQEELEHLFSESTSPAAIDPVGETGDGDAKDKSVFIPHMALEAFEKRRLAEEALCESSSV